MGGARTNISHSDCVDAEDPDRSLLADWLAGWLAGWLSLALSQLFFAYLFI